MQMEMRAGPSKAVLSDLQDEGSVTWIYVSHEAQK